MKQLISQIKSLQNSSINNIVDQRLLEFSSFSNKSEEEWFSELCFCILAANSRQKTAEAIQKQISIEKLDKMAEKEFANLIRANKHRFHNNKAKYIKSALEFKNIKTIIKDKNEVSAREWLVNNVRGLGYKEASHFLRNTGSQNLAILDRHILNLMQDNKIIEKPKTLTKNHYLNIEEEFISISNILKMSPAKLDLFMWYLKTGEVLK